MRYLILLLLTISSNSFAKEYEAGQKNKQFPFDKLTIKANDTVSFPNHDPFYHNIYSLSEHKSFDLGSYPKGSTRKVTFEKPGAYYIECAIHPHMQLTITVE